ncbi:MAG TPA: TonB family protein [Longimicrobiaceae bacterium]|nr:TonB family protein [Longimicrobiaceae bacterium]
MALVSCPECGEYVSSAAPACPHCGYPNPGLASRAAPAPPGAGPSPRGLSPGWIIAGILAALMLMVGLVGFGAYRMMERARERAAAREQQELIDYVEADSAARAAQPQPQPPEDSTYELSTVEVQPELANREEVAAALSRNYPPLLRDAGVTGTVTLRMRVGSDGVVDPGSIQVLESSHDMFSTAATRVAERLRFRPARAGGKPVPVWVTLPVTFQLQS